MDWLILIILKLIEIIKTIKNSDDSLAIKKGHPVVTGRTSFADQSAGLAAFYGH